VPEATMDHANIPDPIAERFEAMEQELIALKKQVKQTEKPS
jgi:serine O-acetyltransferase